MFLLLTAALAADPIAVVELFTSEGCSSCPPTDALLARLDAESRHDGPAVYALSFHVTYWDKLGWVDPSGLSLADARQQAWAARLGDGPYTPQIVVNGARSVVGNQEPAVRAAVAEALAHPADIAVTVSAARSGGHLGVDWSAPLPAGSTLVVVSTEHAVRDVVPRGENAGRTLVHAEVVRDLVEVRGTSGHLELKAPSGAGSVVAFVQAGDGRVMGVGRVEVPG
jgi:hypothetical protein